MALIKSVIVAVLSPTHLGVIKIKKFFYDILEIMGFNALFNFIVGARGVGKTYSAKKYVINRFLKTKEQFFYVRRYDTELERVDTFFLDISKDFHNVDFKVEGNKFFINGEVAGYYYPLSTAIILKSSSFENVTTIIFDEFIIEKGVYQYLPNEVSKFLDMYETIARLRDVRVLFLSNSITFNNPYFSFFKLKKPLNKKQIYVNNDILLQNVVAKDFADNKKKTRFGKIISGTDYESYAIDNQYYLDDTNFIEKKSEKIDYYFTGIINNKEYGFFIDYKEAKIFISESVDKYFNLSYAFTTKDLRENILTKKARDNRMLTLKAVGLNGGLRFENMRVKSETLEVLTKFIF